MVACHQFVPALEPGAVGHHTLEVQRTLRDAGVECEVFAHVIDPRWSDRGRPFEEYGAAFPARRGDRLMYQFAIGSPIAGFLRARPEPKVLNHHNLTPPELLAGWEPAIVPGLLWGRRQLVELAASVDFAVAVSEFNRSDLRSAGYRDVEVVPVLLDLAAFDADVDGARLERLERERAGGGTDLLFVGRVIPNKCQHDLVKVLAAYRAAYDPDARLRIVGSPASAAYSLTLAQYAAALGMTDAVDFAGGVSPGELAAYYRTADVFVSASEHEGFCVPLLEAMHHGVPIVAYGAAAIPETVAGAGVVLEHKAPASMAAAVHRAVSDRTVRAALVAAGTARLADFDIAVTRRRFLDVLATHGIAA